MEPSKEPKVVFKLLCKNQGLGFPCPGAGVGDRAAVIKVVGSSALQGTKCSGD